MDPRNSTIIQTLSGQNKPINISQISRISGLNRHTVARHLDLLELLGRVKKIQVGCSKKYYLTEKPPSSGLLSICSDLIIIVDSNFQIRYISTTAEQKFGIISYQIIGNQLESVNIDIFSSPQVIFALRNYSPNKVVRIEYLHTDGNTYEISILGLPMENGDDLIGITAVNITEKKKREFIIKETARRYKLFFSSMMDCAFMTTIHGQWIDCNDATLRLFGFESKESLFSTNIKNFYSRPGDRDEVIDLISENGGIYEFPVYMKRNDGTDLNIALSATPWRDVNGDLIGFHGISREITGQDNGLFPFPHGHPDGDDRIYPDAGNQGDIIWEYDLSSGHMQYIGSSSDNLLGYTPPEISSKNLNQLVTSESSAKIHSWLDQMSWRYKSGDELVRTIRHNTDLVGKDGSIISADLVTTIFPYSDRRIRKIYGISRIIPEQGPSRSWIQFLRAFFDSFFSHSPFGYGLCDSNGRLLTANKAFLGIIGVTDPSAILSYPLWHDSFPREIKKEQRETYRIVKDNLQFDLEIIKSNELFQIFPSGYITMDMTMPSLPREDDTTFPLYFIQVDRRSPNKFGEMDLEKNYRSLQTAHKKVRLLTSIICHDILNKMTSAHLLNSLILDESVSPKKIQSCFFRQMKDIQAIEEIIDFTRKYQDMGLKEPQWICLHDLIGDTGYDPGFEVLSYVADLEIFADPLITRIIPNLIDNSARHGEKVTKSVFEWKKSGKTAIIYYKDNGVGVTVGEKEKIFERDYGENTGLGLFLIREILEITGISIHECGIPGEGACFEMQIPASCWRERSSPV